METSNRTNADFMLRNALQRSEKPSPELLNRVRPSAICNGAIIRAYPRPRRFILAALLVVMLLTIGAVALAYTGVLSDVFLAVTNSSNRNSGLASDSRRAIVENGYLAIVTPGASVAIDGYSLVLKAYYADARELGFNFTLSGSDLPASWKEIFVQYFSLEMTDSDGDVNSWELRYIEEAHEEASVARGGNMTYFVESRTFPGGHYYYDYVREVFEYEPGDGQDFQINASAVEADDGAYDITVIVTFHDSNSDARVPVGKSAHLKIGFLSLQSSADITDDDAMRQTVMLDGVWDFDIEFESRFIDATELQYVVIDPVEAERLGVAIKNITVFPSVCRIEATLDFSRNELACPDNINNELVKEEPWRLAKFDMMDVGVSAVSDGGVYGNMMSSYDLDAVNGRAVECWFEIGSMFFDAPQALTLVFKGSGGAVIEIPLELAG